MFFRYRKFIIVNFIIFFSLSFAQNNLIIYNIPEHTIIDRKCNPLNESDIECELNNVNFENYREFNISGDTLRLKKIYKDSILQVLEQYRHPYYPYGFYNSGEDYWTKRSGIISVEELDENTRTRFNYLFNRNRCYLKSDQNYKENKIRQSSYKINGILSGIEFLDEYDNIFVIEFVYTDKKVNIWYFNNKVEKDLTLRYSFMNHHIYQYNIFASDNNIINKNNITFIDLSYVTLYDFYTQYSNFYKIYDLFSHRYEALFQYNYSINDKMRKYKVLSKEFGDVSVIYLHYSGIIQGEILNEDEVFKSQAVDKIEFTDGFNNGEVGVIIKSVDDKKYIYKKNEIKHFLLYQNKAIDQKYYELIKSNISYDNFRFEYRESALFDGDSGMRLKDDHPHKNIIEKREYYRDGEYIIIENLDISYLDIPFSYFKKKYIYNEWGDGSDSRWHGYSLDDRLLQIHRLDNNNLIIEFQDMNNYRIMEIDQNLNIDWTHSYDRSDISNGCGSTSHLGYSYIYNGTIYDENQYYHELLQIAGQPMFLYSIGMILDKYPEVYVANFMNTSFGQTIKQDLSSSIEDSLARSYYIKDRSYANDSFKPPMKQSIIHKIDNKGNILGYWYAIIDWHIVNNDKSLYDLSKKYNSSVYETIRVNSIFNKPFKSRIADYPFQYIEYIYADNIFNIDFEKEFKKKYNKYDLYKFFKKNKNNYYNNPLDIILSSRDIDPDFPIKKMHYYQKNNFINHNYIYNGQLLYFYKKARQYIPQNGFLVAKKYDDDSIQFTIELKDFNLQYNDPIVIINNKGIPILESHGDSLLIINDYNGRVLVEEHYKLKKLSNMDSYDFPYTKEIVYSKRSMDYKPYNNKLPNELTQYISLDEYRDSLSYIVEVNEDKYIKNKFYYYKNDSLAIKYDFINNKPEKITCRYPNGNLWFVHYGRNYSYKERRGYNNPTRVTKKNILYPYIAYEGFDEDGSLRDILEFSDEYYYRLVKDGVLIESNRGGKYEKYFSDGTQQYIIEGIDNGKEYYQTGKLKKDFRMINKESYNTNSHRYNGYFDAYKEYYEDGSLKDDIYFSDLNRSISYYENGIVENEHNFEGHRYRNKDCYSELAYYENGNIKYTLRRKYNKDEDFCELLEFTVYFENGQLNQIIEPDTEKYFSYTHEGDMLVDGYASKNKKNEITVMNISDYKKRAGNFNNWIKYDQLREYKYYRIEKRSPKYIPTVYLNKEYSYDDKKKVWILKALPEYRQKLSEHEYNLSFYRVSSLYNDFTRISSISHVLIGEEYFKISKNDTNQVIIDYFDIEECSSTSNYHIKNDYTKSKLNYINKQLEGEQFYYHTRVDIYDKKTISRKYNYKNDRLAGKQYEYYVNGQILLESLYFDGLKKGTWNYYYENGNIKGTEEYNELGQLHQIKKYNLDGFEICNILVNDE